MDLVLVRSGGGTAHVADADLVGTRWALGTLRGETVEVDGRASFLQLRTGEGDLQVCGESGCNSFRGTFTQTGAALEFGSLASTRKACPAPLMDLEARCAAREDTRDLERSASGAVPLPSA